MDQDTSNLYLDERCSMNGHAELLTMRLQGKKPAWVFLNDFPCKTDWFTTGDHVTISTGASDAPETLDLRFLAGVKVSVASRSENRAKRFFEACKRAGAKSVAAMAVNLEEVAHKQTGWYEVWHG